jgi:hypothetical protein
MNKIHFIFIIVVAALAIFYTEKSFSETTTIFAPNGTVTVCTTGQGIVLCV